MSQKVDQIIALAGIFQSAHAVNALAQKGHCDPNDILTAVNSIYCTQPDSTLSVFGEKANLHAGFLSLHNALAKQANAHQPEVLRYALALIHIEGKLKKDQTMMSLISERIQQSNHQISHLGADHPNVIANLASIYMDTISTFKTRIHVRGHATRLNVESTAQKIRTLLLAGVRASILWRQVGGHRWHFMFQRQNMLDICKQQMVNH